MQNNRVLYIVGSLDLGGIERLTTDLALGLKKTGLWDTAVCCVVSRNGAFLSNLETENIPVYLCPINRRNIATFPFRFARLLKDIQPALIHSHVDFSMPWQIMGARLGGVNKIIFTHHSEYQYWKMHFWARLRIVLYFWLCWPFISSYTTVSKKVSQSLAKLVLRREIDFPIIHNPVDLASFTSSSSVRITARNIFGVKQEHFVIGNVASFREAKGHKFLITAVESLVKKNPLIRVVLIGDGPNREVILDQIAQAGLKENFIILGQRTDVHKLYAGMDCFVLPSMREGFPLALIEAMSSCLPVIAANVGGVSEAMGENCGLLIPPKDPQKLAEGIAFMYENTDSAAEMGRKANLYVKENFDLDAILSQYIRLYSHV